MPALGGYDKRRPEVKKKIDDIPQWQKVFQEVITEDIAGTKKPVRWNFLKDNEGLLNLGLLLAPEIRLNLAYSLKKAGKEQIDPIQIIREGRINERDYIDGFDDIAKAIESGSHTFGWSIGDLLFMGTDFLSNSEFRDKFNKIMEKQQPEAPETWQGDLISLLIQFGVPSTTIAKIGTRAKSVQKIKNLLEKMGPSKAS